MLRLLREVPKWAAIRPRTSSEGDRSACTMANWSSASFLASVLITTLRRLERCMQFLPNPASVDEQRRPSAGNLERRAEVGSRAAADPDVEHRRVLHPVSYGGVPIPQLRRPQGESHCTSFAGIQADSLEAFELADRPGRRAVALVNIELDDLLGRCIPHVGDLHRHCQRIVGGNAGPIKLQLPIAKLPIAQSVPEWKQRCALLVPIAAPLVLRLMRHSVAVNHRHLPDRPGPAEGQLAAGNAVVATGRNTDAVAK